MPIKAPPPVPSPYIEYDYRHTGDFDDETHFLPPTHLIKTGPTRGVDPSMVPEVDIDTSFDEADILASQPTPKVRPLFLGIRRMLAARAIEHGNDQLQDFARQHRVARHVGHSLLAGESYMGRSDPDRPGSKQELGLARSLGKIQNRRRRAGAQVWAGAQSATAPPVASRQEKKDAKKSTKRYRHGTARINELDNRFRATITSPARKAARATARRDKAVAKLEAIKQAKERRDQKIQEVKDEVAGSARALGAEIVERHQEAWDMTKEQAERVAQASVRAGKLVVHETVATTEVAAKGSKHTSKFYAEVGRGAADIYWRAAKRAGRGTAKGVRKLYRAAKPKK